MYHLKALFLDPTWIMHSLARITSQIGWNVAGQVSIFLLVVITAYYVACLICMFMHFSGMCNHTHRGEYSFEQGMTDNDIDVPYDPDLIIGITTCHDMSDSRQIDHTWSCSLCWCSISHGILTRGCGYGTCFIISRNSYQYRTLCISHLLCKRGWIEYNLMERLINAEHRCKAVTVDGRIWITLWMKSRYVLLCSECVK